MNKELKFRAWDETNKSMSEPFTLQEWIEASAKAAYYMGKAEGLMNDITDNAEQACTDKRLFIQFTGLKDKNNKEICAGDLITIPMGFAGDFSFKPFNAVVEFIEDGWGIIPILPMTTWQDFRWEETVVIGNIYQNPGMLNKNEKQ